MFIHAANIVFSRLENKQLSNEEEVIRFVSLTHIINFIQVNGIKRGSKKIQLSSGNENDRIKKKSCCKNL